MTDSIQTLAQARTNWAEDRTVLASERTFAGWVRTGLGLIAIAIGLKAVFAGHEAVLVAKAAASGFLLLAMFIFWMSRHTATATLDKLHRHDVASASRSFIQYTTLALICLTLGVGVVLWGL